MAKDIWIVTADAGRAIGWSVGNGRRGKEPLRLFELESNIEESREIGSDRPGRSFDSHGEGRHAMEPPTDPKRHSAENFARDIISALQTHLKEGRFKRLVLAAPPVMLGDLRRLMPDALAATLIAERDKDLTNTPADKLLAHFDDIVGL